MEKSTLEEDTEIYYSIIIENDASNTNVACDALIRTSIASTKCQSLCIPWLTDWLWLWNCGKTGKCMYNSAVLCNSHTEILRIYETNICRTYSTPSTTTNQTEDCIERHTNRRKGARQKRITGNAILYYCCDFSTKAQTIRRLRWIRGYSWHI